MNSWKDSVDTSKTHPTVDSVKVLPIQYFLPSDTFVMNTRPTLKRRTCPALVCTKLIKFKVNEEKCKMCGLCFKACPAGAVSWEKKKPAVIDQIKCTKCKSCIQACKFGAID